MCFQCYLKIERMLLATQIRLPIFIFLINLTSTLDQIIVTGEITFEKKSIPLNFGTE